MGEIGTTAESKKGSQGILSDEQLLLHAQYVPALLLQARIRENLSRRFASSKDYSHEEIAHVTSLNRRLFPKSFEITTQVCNRFRVLCSLAQAELKPTRTITSHRKILGPIIVLLKKLTWPLIKVHLQDTIKAQREFNCGTVEVLARNVVEIEALKRTANGQIKCAEGEELTRMNANERELGRVLIRVHSR